MIRAACTLRRQFSITAASLEKKIKKISQSPGKTSSINEKFWRDLKSTTDKYKNVWRLSVDYFEKNSKIMSPEEREMAEKILKDWPQLERPSLKATEIPEEVPPKIDNVGEINQENTLQELTNNLQIWLLTLEKQPKESSFTQFLVYLDMISSTNFEKRSAFNLALVSQCLRECSVHLREHITPSISQSILQLYARMHVFVPSFHKLLLSTISMRDSTIVQICDDIGICCDDAGYVNEMKKPLDIEKGEINYLQAMKDGFKVFEMLMRRGKEEDGRWLGFQEFLKFNPPNYSMLDLRSKAKLLSIYTGIFCLKDTGIDIDTSVIEHTRHLIKVIVRKILQDIRTIATLMPDDYRFEAEIESLNFFFDFISKNHGYERIFNRMERVIQNGADIVLLNEVLNFCLLIMKLDKESREHCVGFITNMNIEQNGKRFDSAMILSVLEPIKGTGVFHKTIKNFKTIKEDNKIDQIMNRACRLALHFKDPANDWLGSRFISTDSMLSSILNELWLDNDSPVEPEKTFKPKKATLSSETNNISNNDISRAESQKPKSTEIRFISLDPNVKKQQLTEIKKFLHAATSQKSSPTAKPSSKWLVDPSPSSSVHEIIEKSRYQSRAVESRAVESRAVESDIKQPRPTVAGKIARSTTATPLDRWKLTPQSIYDAKHW